MKLGSVLVAAAFVGLSGYTIYTHLGLGGDAGPVAEVVTLPAKRPGVPEPVPAVRTPAPETPTTQVVTQTVGQNRTPSEPATQRAVAVPNDRASLARALQRELQRVGCYDGEISGNWSTSTRMAMKAFTDRVNASLPTDAPDYILLSLVQRHEGKACGTGCPTGQLQSDEGRCVPSAVLARASPKPTASVAGEAKAAGAGESKEGSNVSSSWAPTAGLAAVGAGAAILAAPEVRGSSTTSSARGTAGLPGPRPETASVEPREDRSRYSATRETSSRESESRPTASRADVDADPANRDRSSNQRVARAEEAPKSEANRGDEAPPRKARKAKYKQPKIVRQFLRSMKGVMAGMPF
jgi:hypothetical protein